MRVALGAGRFRLVRQVLTESLLLSAAGSLPGVVLAYFGAAALVRIVTSGRTIIGLPQRIELQVQPDAQVLLFTAGRSPVDRRAVRAGSRVERVRVRARAIDAGERRGGGDEVAAARSARASSSCRWRCPWCC